MGNSGIEVAVVEKDPDYGAALKAIINSTGDMHCGVVYANRRHALEAIPESAPNIIILGLGAKRTGNLPTFVRQLIKLCPQASVIVLAHSNDSATIFEALSAGAVGYLLRSGPWTSVCRGIREVYAGGSTFASSVLPQVLSLFRSMSEEDQTDNLSEREQEILRLLRERSRNKEIAIALKISVATVRTHLRSIYVKLRIRCRSEVTSQAKVRNPESPEEPEREVRRKQRPPRIRHLPKARAVENGGELQLGLPDGEFGSSKAFESASAVSFII